MRHICQTCGHAVKFDYPPTPGGSDDGVLCKSPQMIHEYSDCATYDTILLWRVEIVADDVECPYRAARAQTTEVTI
jgi:hypothetical protein